MSMKLVSKFKALIRHQGFRRYFGNTSWMMAEQLLRIIAGLFVGIWIARYLGPEKFGIFSYILSFTAIFAGIAKLGLDGIVVRELLRDPEKRDVYLGTAFWLKIFGAFLAIAVMAAIMPFTNNDLTTNIYILIVASGMLCQSFEVVEFYFQSQVRARTISICKLVQLSISSIVKIYLVLNEFELIGFVIVAAFDALTLSVSYFIVYKIHEKGGFYKNFNSNVAGQLLKDSWPLIFSAILVSVYMRIDQIMIKEMLGEHEVGIYSTAVRLSEAFYFVPMLVTASLYPAILSAKSQSEELYKKRLQRLYAFMVWMAVVIALPMTFLSDWLILLLYGQSYQGAGSVLMVHVWSAIFVFLGVSFGKYLIVENLAAVAFRRTLFGALSNIALNYWLIPIYGVLGAAVSTFFAQFFANYLFDIFDRRLRQQLIMKTQALFMPWKIIC